ENGLSNGAVAADASTATSADSADYVEYAYRLLETGRPRLDPGNARHQARYYALTGQLYEIRERYEEALRATAEAIRLLQGQRAEDLLLFYEWQAGRLFKALNHRQAALAAYRRAAGYVDAIRGDIPVTYHNGRSSFLELFGPLYRGLLDLLLQNVEDGASPRIERARLEEARGMMERLKQTELEDFFHDRCLLTGFEAYRKRLSELGLAVLYPVILDDRLELLLIIGDEYERFSVQVPASLFETSVRDFAAALREGSDDTLAGSRRLYDWLIRPWAGRLDEAHIDTLVYIPDGPLRLLPLAALHDGRQYLIERLAITTLPSLAVLPERSKPTAKGVVLLVGLSKPGPETVTELPETLLEQLRLASAESTERSLAHGAVRSIAYRSEQSESGRIEPKADLEKLAEVLSLPGVEKEVATLAEIQRSRVVLNRDYTLQHFDLLVRQPLHHMIHIASHGFFGGTSDSSFIMTYDRILTMDHLQQLLEQRSTDEPIDMLVLSACQTAEGDDRAPLGLSGVALKARADSALGSLWPISDEAAVKLMKGFYSGITQQRLSKAKALQQAQLSLLRDANLAHPFYWSPFVLVGHW
ncbi:MAG: CHAT domain-containing protein, partial [Gammaproteobacteria bacterium]